MGRSGGFAAAVAWLPWLASLLAALCASPAAAAWDGPEGPQLVVILAAQRTGTHYLQSILLRHPDLVTFGEAFNRPNEHTLQLGDKWSNKYTKRSNPDEFNTDLYNYVTQQHPTAKVYSYVVFEKHLEDSYLEEKIIRNPNIRVMIFTRSNFVEVYASDVKARSTGAYFGVDTSSLNVTLSKHEMRHAWYHHRNWYLKVSRLCRDHGVFPFMVNYEALNHPVGPSSTYFMAHNMFSWLDMDESRMPSWEEFTRFDCDGVGVEKLAKQPLVSSVENYEKAMRSTINFAKETTDMICRHMQS